MHNDFSASGWHNNLTNEDQSRRSVINFVEHEYLQCTFYEHDRLVGCIPYFDKNYSYVKSAADNWITGVMTHEVIKEHTLQQNKKTNY